MDRDIGLVHGAIAAPERRPHVAERDNAPSGKDDELVIDRQAKPSAMPPPNSPLPGERVEIFAKLQRGPCCSTCFARRDTVGGPVARLQIVVPLSNRRFVEERQLFQVPRPRISLGTSLRSCITWR